MMKKKTPKGCKLKLGMSKQVLDLVITRLGKDGKKLRAEEYQDGLERYTTEGTNISIDDLKNVPGALEG